MKKKLAYTKPWGFFAWRNDEEHIELMREYAKSVHEHHYNIRLRQFVGGNRAIHIGYDKGREIPLHY